MEFFVPAFANLNLVEALANVHAENAKKCLNAERHHRAPVNAEVLKQLNQRPHVLKVLHEVVAHVKSA